MPTLKQMVKQMLLVEEQDKHEEPGAYPVFFKNDFYQIGFILLLRWEHFKRKVKKLWRL